MPLQRARNSYSFTECALSVISTCLCVGSLSGKVGGLFAGQRWHPPVSSVSWEQNENELPSPKGCRAGVEGQQHFQKHPQWSMGPNFTHWFGFCSRRKQTNVSFMDKQKHLENGGSAPHADEGQSRDRTETWSVWRADKYLKFVYSWSKVQPLTLDTVTPAAAMKQGRNHEQLNTAECYRRDQAGSQRGSHDAMSLR